MPVPKSGKQIRVSPENAEKIRQLAISGLDYNEISKLIPIGKTNFWNVIRPVQEDIWLATYNRKLTQMQKLTEAQKGWIAGIIDGEGWIGLTFKNNYIHPRIGVTSTTPLMQDKLYELCGGATCAYKRAGKNCRKTSTWRQDTIIDIAVFLTIIEPYLVVKKHISKVVREFAVRRMKKRWTPYEKQDAKAVELVSKYNSRGLDGTRFDFKPTKGKPKAKISIEKINQLLKIQTKLQNPHQDNQP